MFEALWSVLRRSRRLPSRVGQGTIPSVPRTSLTITEVLRAQVEAVATPRDVERGEWLSLATRVFERAADLPAPPSFPSIAIQVLELVRDPDVDLNRLVATIQRDAAIATAILQVANSPALAPAIKIHSLGDAIRAIGVSDVAALVIGSSGRGYYRVATPSELEMFPALWNPMFEDAMANAFTTGRVALDTPGARSERAMLAGLLSEIGRPIALRIIGRLVQEGMPKPSDGLVIAALDEVAREVGTVAIVAMHLPEELGRACLPHANTIESHIAQLVAAISSVQRPSPRIWANADAVQRHADALHMQPLAVRALFTTRREYFAQVQRTFG